MKKLLTLAALVSLFFFGCNQEAELISPVSNSSNSHLKLISLPTPDGGLSTETLFTQTKEIDGDDGGYFSASFIYEGGPFGQVYCASRLTFLPGAFSGEREIKKTLDSETASMVFGPSMQFNVPVKYTLKIRGLDLSDVNPETLAFVYIAPDGSTQNCEYDQIVMDAASGTVAVYNAKLGHFSRYGFVN